MFIKWIYVDPNGFYKAIGRIETDDDKGVSVAHCILIYGYRSTFSSICFQQSNQRVARAYHSKVAQRVPHKAMGGVGALKKQVIYIVHFHCKYINV